ncbi:MAG: HDOD domain-containing protein [candidate division Zixibacteria bacterium]|nr:HDOD domain-containing protein [candidate division Zixibacteria bacterium]
MNVCPRQFVEVQEQVQKGEDVIAVEKEYFDVDHAELGGLIAARWHVPVQLQEVIRLHHRSDTSDNLMVSVVRLANAVTNSIYSSNIESVGRLLDAINIDEQIQRRLATHEELEPQPE